MELAENITSLQLVDTIETPAWHTLEECLKWTRFDQEVGWIPRCPVRYVLGLDLGKQMDFSALSVLERHGEGHDAFFHCRHLQRWKLGTSYPTIVADVRLMLMREPFTNQRRFGLAEMAIDATGVGLAILDLFRSARPRVNAKIRPIVIHGGNEVVEADGGYRVPKRELVSAVQASLQTDRLKIAADLPDVPILTAEMQNFEVQVSEAGRDSYEARVGQHDDLVLSVACALWLARQRPTGVVQVAGRILG